MAIVYTTKEIDGVEYDYIYSDEGKYVVWYDGQQWTDVIDPLGAGRVYTEGDYYPTESTPEQLLAILLGDDNG